MINETRFAVIEKIENETGPTKGRHLDLNGSPKTGIKTNLSWSTARDASSPSSSPIGTTRPNGRLSAFRSKPARSRGSKPGEKNCGTKSMTEKEEKTMSKAPTPTTALPNPAASVPVEAGKKMISAGNLAGFLDANRAKIAEGCAKLIDPAKLTRICVQLVNDDKTGALRRCTQESFLVALLDCLACGLLPTHGRGQLIPYGNEVKFQIGYQGILELAARAGITANPYLIFEKPVRLGRRHRGTDTTNRSSARAGPRKPWSAPTWFATYPDGSKASGDDKTEIDAIANVEGENAGPWVNRLPRNGQENRDPARVQVLADQIHFAA